MRKLITITLALTLVCFAKAYGQADTIKNGAYRNNVDFSKNKPIYTSGFRFTKKYRENLPGFYKIRSEKPKIRKEIMNYGIWAIYDSSHLYLNAKRLGMANGFIRIDTIRRYSYFKGIPVKSLSQQEGMEYSALYFGLLGAAVSSLAVAEQNKDCTNYILDIHSSLVYLLTEDYLLKMLKPYAWLSNRYKAEPKSSSLGVMLKYIGLLNEQTEE